MQFILERSNSKNGRSLELNKGLKHAKRFNSEGKSIARNSKLNIATPGYHLHYTTKTGDGFVEAFRPTTPGHSPGSWRTREAELNPTTISFVDI
ncbi:hypothetical protein SADUNF_Sadunf07G0038300 [Salix dunnii]|uniref:Uncharacterized protein n=1 Tax=Salix dunnii TaxID=1413687 RepID=A0A835MV18_9ROSI|nr:hypothetical protein SADUNF_Sadunf07G0038300 [Salix dunnii]